MKRKTLYIAAAILIIVLVCVLTLHNHYRSGAKQFDALAGNINHGLSYSQVHQAAISSGFRHVVIISKSGEQILKHNAFVQFVEKGIFNATSEEYYFTGVLYNPNIVISYDPHGYVIEISGSN